MYHCHLRIYLAGRQRGLLEQIKDAAPLPRFTHEFLESGTPEGPLAAQADVILADLEGLDAPDAVYTLAVSNRLDASLILLADREQIDSLEGRLSSVQDVWTTPMSTAELGFRFQR